jgi:hypothetical protein
VIGFDGLAENLPLSQEVLLANKFIQGPRPHPIRKGSLFLEQFLFVFLEEFRLLFQHSISSCCAQKEFPPPLETVSQKGKSGKCHAEPWTDEDQACFSI